MPALFHNRVLSILERDLLRPDVTYGSCNTHEFGGRVLVKEENTYIYVRSVRLDAQHIKYVVANISIPENLRGKGLVKKIITTVKSKAPKCITTIEFECVNNKRLFCYLIKEGFISPSGDSSLSLNFNTFDKQQN